LIINTLRKITTPRQKNILQRNEKIFGELKKIVLPLHPILNFNDNTKMAVKIRLARHGKKAYAFYHIVVADSRAPRDGKLIENLGTYNPNTNPATIELNFESALSWLNKGAQPTDTVRAILSRQGVMLKKHLDEGVRKGAFTAAVADERLAEWLKERDAKIIAMKQAFIKAGDDTAKQRLANESKTKEAKGAALAEKRHKLAADAKAKAEAEAAAKAKAKAEAEAVAKAAEFAAAAPAEMPVKAPTEAPDEEKAAE
jgi:small subunit ribosomal protein S16